MAVPLRFALPLLAAGVPMLAGCSDPTRYPSLALRPIETMSLAEPAARPVPAGSATAVADARFAPFVAQAQSGDAAFRQAIGDARPTLARGRDAAVGSDEWAAAQVALSRLQPARTQVTQALLSLQTAAEAPETRDDAGLAAAAARALALVVAIDRTETEAMAAVTPIRS